METHDAISPDAVCCPACRARQEWSDTCRRCKCDLTLLRRTVAACWQARRRSLAALRAGRLTEALEAARQQHDSCPGADSARLLAVCHLLLCNWPAALTLLRRWG